MEGSADDYIPDYNLFFILGASDRLIQNLKEAAVRVTMRTSNQLDYLLNQPIKDLMEIIEIIIATDKEAKEARKRK